MKSHLLPTDEDAIVQGYAEHGHAKSVANEHAPHYLDDPTKEFPPYTLHDDNRIGQATLAHANLLEEKIRG